MAKKNRSLMIIGSIVLGLISVLLVYVILISTGIIVGREYTLRFEAISREKEYDGTPLSLNDYRLVEGQEYLDQFNHRVIVSFSGNQTDVGESVGSLEIAVFDQYNAEVTSRYNIITTDATLKVTPRTITIRVDTPTPKAYDGTSLDIPDDAYEIIAGESVAGQNFNIHLSGTQTEIGSSAVTADIELSDDQGNPINPDNYRVVFEGEQPEIVVRPRYLNVTTYNQQNYYNGNPYTVTNATFNQSLSEMRPGDVLRSIQSTFSEINAGEYPLDKFEWRVYDSAGRDVSNIYDIDPNSTFGTYTIMPVRITLETLDLTKVYDGTPLVGGNNYHVNNWEQSASTDRYEVSLNATITNVGTVDNSATIMIRNNKGEDVTSNYEIVENFGKLEVIKREITIKTFSESKQFDGAPIIGNEVLSNGENYRITTGTLASGDEITVELNTKVSDVGVKTNTINKVTIIDKNKNDVTANYYINKDEGNLEITKTSLTIITETMTWDYDGLEHTAQQEEHPGLPDTCKIVFKNWPVLTDATCNEKGEIVEVLNKPDYVIYDANNNVVFDSTNKQNQANFAVTAERWGKLVINPIDVTIRTDSLTKDYDGTNIECHVWEVIAGTKRTTDTFVMTWPNDYANVLRNKNKDVLEVDNKPTVVVIDKNNQDITQNYRIKIDAGKIKVTPISLYITTKDVSKYYDGTPLVVTENDYEITGLKGGDHIDNVKTVTNYINVKKTNGKVVSIDNTIEFVVRNSENQDVTNNYELVEESIGKLLVSPITIKLRTGSHEFTYNGLEQSYEDDCVITDGDGNPLPSSITYELSNFKKFINANVDESEKNKQNTCDVVFYYDVNGVKTRIDKDNIALDASYGTVVVNRFKVKVYTKDQTKTYDGKPFVYTEANDSDWYEITDENGGSLSDALPEGVSCKVDVTQLDKILQNVVDANDGKKYSVPMMFTLGSTNITSNFECDYPTEAKLKIDKITISIETAAGTHPYDGEAHVFSEDAKVYDADDNEITVTYDLNATSNDGTPYCYLSDFTQFVNYKDNGDNKCNYKLFIYVDNQPKEVKDKNLNVVPRYGKGTITKLNVEISTKDINKTYDGLVLEYNDDDDKWYSVGGCHAITGANVNIPEGNEIRIDAKSLNDDIKNFIDYKEGGYDYQVKVKMYKTGTNNENENFTFEYTKGKVVIDQISVRLTCSTALDSVTYDGTGHTFEDYNDLEFLFPDGYDEDIANQYSYKFVNFKEFTNVSDKGKNEFDIEYYYGDKKVSDKNFKLTAESALNYTYVTVAPKAITVVGKTIDKSFDGVPLTISAINESTWFEINEEELPIGHDVVVNYDSLNSYLEDKLDYNENGYTFKMSEYLSIHKAGDAGVNENYKLIDGTNVKININKVQVTVRFTKAMGGNTISKTYDGTPLCALDKIGDDYDPSGIYFNLVDEEKLTNLGISVLIESAKSITDVQRDKEGNATSVDNDVTLSLWQSGRDVTDNFDIKLEKTSLQVNPIIIYAKTNGGTFPYDGEEHYDDEVTIARTDPIDYDLSDYTVEFLNRSCLKFKDCKYEKGKLVGYTNKVTFTLKVTKAEANVTNNFDARLSTIDMGVIEITPKKLIIELEGETKPFDGTALALPQNQADLISGGYLVINSDSLDFLESQNHKLTITPTASIVKVGSVANDFVATVVDKDDPEKDYSSNYDVENLKANSKLEVTKLELSAKSGSKTIIYGNDPEHQSLEYNDFVGGWDAFLDTLPSGWTADYDFTGSVQNGIGRCANEFTIKLYDPQGLELKDSPYKGCVEVTNTEWGTLEIIPYITGTGDLSGESAVPSGDVVSFYMRVNTEGIIYLRDRSYGNYNGQGWDYIADYTDGYNGNSIYAKYLKDNDLSDTATVRISMASDMPYLVPYYAKSNDLYNNLNGGDTHVSKAHSILSPYEYEYYMGHYNSEKGYYEYSINNEVLSLTDDDPDYRAFESAYRTYVHNTYLDIDESLRDKILAIEDIKVDDKLALNIANYIRDNFTYGSNDKREGQEDVVSFFLFDPEGQTGTCQDFASAAVLMYRAYNIPARYVTGFVCYVKNDSAYEPNTDITVNQTLAHSWVEIYIDGLGWVYVEATPVTVNGKKLPLNITTEDVSDKSEPDLSGDIDKTPHRPDNESILKVESGHSGKFYLRGQSFGVYNGAGFAKVDPGDTYYDPFAAYNPLTLLGNEYKTYYKLYNMRIKNLNYDAYLTPYGVTGDYTAEAYVDDNTFGDDTYLGGNYGSKYNVNYVVIDPSIYGELELTGARATVLSDYTAYVEGPGSPYLDTTMKLALSNALDDIISDYSMDSGTTLEKMAKVQKYLQEDGGFIYTFEGWDYSASDDVALAFLTTKKGVCQHFAMIGTLLLRKLGIPARYTSGVVVNITNENVGQEVTVRDSSRHAWVEVFLDNIGWVPLEVTGSTAASDVPIDYDDGTNVHTVVIKPHRDAIQYYVGLTEYIDDRVLGEFSLEDTGKYIVMGTTRALSVDLGYNDLIVTSYSIIDKESTKDVTKFFNVIIQNPTENEEKLHVYLEKIIIKTQGATRQYNGETLSCHEIDEGNSTIDLIHAGHTFNLANLVFVNSSIGPAPTKCANDIDVKHSTNLITDDETGNDVTYQYWVVAEEAGQLSITKRKIRIYADSAYPTHAEYLEYCALHGTEEYRCETYTYTPGALVAGDYIDDVVFNANSYLDEDQTEAENVITSVKIKNALDEDVTSCYLITLVSGDLYLDE